MTSAAPLPDDRPFSDDQRAIVQGGALVMAAKLVHVFAGFGLYFVLALLFTRTLGAADGAAAFGVWGATLSIVNPVNMMFVAGTMQVVSHFVARSGRGGNAFAVCALAQLYLVVGVFVLFELLAPSIAAWRLNDPAYAAPLRIGALIFVFYAWKSLYQGYLNGHRRFREQAWLDIGASVARMLLVLGVAALGGGVSGSLWGFVASAAVMTAVAATWVRPRAATGPGAPGLGDVYAFQGKVMAMTLLANLLMNVDVQAVAAYGSSDPETARRLAGYYTGSQKLAQIPYSLILALTVIIFPLIAREAESKDPAVAAGIVRQGMRTLLLLAVPCTVILAVTADESLALVFSSLARAAAEAGDPRSAFSGPLVYLAIGYGLFSVFMMLNSILTAGGQPGRALLIVAATLALGEILTTRLAASQGPAGAALGISGAWAVGVFTAGAFVFRRYGALVAPLSCLRIIGSGAIVFLVAAFLPASGMLLFVKDLVLAGLFLGLILACGEVRLAEIASLLGKRT